MNQSANFSQLSPLSSRAIPVITMRQGDWVSAHVGRGKIYIYTMRLVFENSSAAENASIQSRACIVGMCARGSECHSGKRLAWGHLECQIPAAAPAVLNWDLHGWRHPWLFYCASLVKSVDGSRAVSASSAKNVEVVGESGQTACRQFFLRFSRASPRACLPARAQVYRKPTGEKRNMSDRSQMIFIGWNLPNGFSQSMSDFSWIPLKN